MEFVAAIVILLLAGLVGQLALSWYLGRPLADLEALAISFACAGLVLAFSTAHAEQSPKFKIAIIDTGYDPELNDGPKLKLCKHGHVDFTNAYRPPQKNIRHGSDVATIIARELKNVDYCAIVYRVGRYYDAEDIITAFYKASYEDVVAINASYSADRPYSVGEREAIKDAAKRVNSIFVAAGNDSLNLDQQCLSFPTCFDIPHVISVGGLGADGKRHPLSNYGSKVKLWFFGGFNGIFGTSFAAPRALAAYVKFLDQKSREQMIIRKQSEKQLTPPTNTQTSTSN